MVTRAKIFIENYKFSMNLAYRIIPKTVATKNFHCSYQNGLVFEIVRSISTTKDVLSQKKLTLNPSQIVKRDGVIIKKKTEPQKQIILVHDSKEKVLTMVEAMKLAHNKGLHLVKTKKPSPKSMDFYELSKVQGVSAKEAKEVRKTNLKQYVFKINIAEHDLLVKVKGLIKALNKYNIANFIVQNNSKELQKTEELSDRIQQALKDAGVSFQITKSKGSYMHKSFTLESVKESVVSVKTGKAAQNNTERNSSHENS